MKFYCSKIWRPENSNAIVSSYGKISPFRKKPWHPCDWNFYHSITCKNDPWPAPIALSIKIHNLTQFRLGVKVTHRATNAFKTQKWKKNEKLERLQKYIFVPTFQIIHYLNRDAYNSCSSKKPVFTALFFYYRTIAKNP